MIRISLIPTREECLALIQQYEMLPHIVRHSRLVTDVALLISTKLNKSGQVLDLALVEAGALLHDITKTVSIETKENHAKTGGELLASLGYPKVADVVRQHIVLDPGLSDGSSITEAEIVNYSDKRVKHEEVVDIKERFEDVWERYVKKLPALRDRFEEVQAETRRLEQKIFLNIDISPEEVGNILFSKRV
jgi:putative nucleotidyltransferase with HDIG domain